MHQPIFHLADPRVKGTGVAHMHTTLSAAQRALLAARIDPRTVAPGTVVAPDATVDPNSVAYSDQIDADYSSLTRNIFLGLTAAGLGVLGWYGWKYYKDRG